MLFYLVIASNIAEFLGLLVSNCCSMFQELELLLNYFFPKKIRRSTQVHGQVVPCWAMQEIKITLDTYSHWYEGDSANWLERLGESFPKT